MCVCAFFIVRCTNISPIALTEVGKFECSNLAQLDQNWENSLPESCFRYCQSSGQVSIKKLFTVELSLNDNCFERPPASYGLISMYGLVFHVYFMVNLANMVSGQSLGNFYGHLLHWLVHVSDLRNTWSLLQLAWREPHVQGYQSVNKLKFTASLFCMKSLT